MASVSRSGDESAAYQRIHESEEFATLRHRFRAFVVPVTIAFLVWYMTYVLCAIYAHDFMSKKVAGNINLGLVFGVLQFVSTFGIAWWYSRKARRDFDPIAEKLKVSYDEEVGPR